MALINLLPPDLTPKKSVVRLTSILTKVSYASVAVLLTLIIVFLGIFFMDSYKVKDLEKQQSGLIGKIKVYEQTEHQVTLAKDRISKIKEIWLMKNVSNSLDAFNRVLSFMEGSMFLNSADLSSEKSEITLNTVSANSVTKFMGSLVTSDLYSSVILKTFSFNPSYGYRISFEGISK